MDAVKAHEAFVIKLSQTLTSHTFKNNWTLVGIL